MTGLTGVPSRLAAVAAIGAALAIAPPRGSTQGTLPDGIDRRLGYVRMADGERLPYILYRPSAPGPVPILVWYSPYAGGGLDIAAPGGTAEEALAYVRAGFGVLAASVRGTGCSKGVLDFQSPSIARDGATVVEWAARQPWSDGNIGLFGNSYMGMTAFMVAAQRPAGLKAIAAGAPPATIYHDTFFPGGIYNYGQAAPWTFLSQPGSSARGAEFRGGAGDRDCAALRAAQQPVRMFYELRDHPLYDRWWADKSILRDAARVDVPVLIAHAWQDQQIAVAGGIELFREVRSTRKLLLSNGGHSFFNEWPLMEEKIRWFDLWLKQRPTGIETEPSVTFFFERRRQEDDTWTSGWAWTFDAWPPPGAQSMILYLTGEGLLGPAAPPAGTPGARQRTYVYPLGSESLASNAAFSVVPSPAGSLAYRTAPMKGDLTLLGAPQLTLYMASDQPDTDLMAVLHDVAPDGHVTYLQRGFLRASHHVSAPAEGERGIGGHDRAAPLVPGRPYRLVVPLFPVGHVVRAGHVLELAILAPPTLPSPAWALATVSAPAVNTIFHGGAYSSALSLPTLRDRHAQAPAPPCGALPFQPCRPGR